MADSFNLGTIVVGQAMLDFSLATLVSMANFAERFKADSLEREIGSAGFRTVPVVRFITLARDCFGGEALAPDRKLVSNRRRTVCILLALKFPKPAGNF